MRGCAGVPPSASVPAKLEMPQTPTFSQEVSRGKADTPKPFGALNCW